MSDSAQFFEEAERARSMGAVGYQSGNKRIQWLEPPRSEQPVRPVVEELDYVQRERVVSAWLEGRGLDRDGLEALIRREEEALSA